MARPIGRPPATGCQAPKRRRRMLELQRPVGIASPDSLRLALARCVGCMLPNDICTRLGGMVHGPGSYTSDWPHGSSANSSILTLAEGDSQGGLWSQTNSNAYS